MATLFRAASALARGALGLDDAPPPPPPKMKYLTQPEAIAVDEALFESFSVDSLMELAGLSVAAAVRDAHPLPKGRRVLCACGPGNNGGDGLVAARHLAFFGYAPTVVYPKRSSKPLFEQLVKQMELMRIPTLSFLPDNFESDYDVILDAVFGFSFAGSARAPFDMLLAKLATSKLPIVSVDVPSGWDVERGPPETGNLPVVRPQTLVSLTAPKLCAERFAGRHYLGGRFVPPDIQARFGFEQSAFPGADQILRLDLPAAPERDASGDASDGDASDDDADDAPGGAKEKEYYYF